MERQILFYVRNKSKSFLIQRNEYGNANCNIKQVHKITLQMYNSVTDYLIKELRIYVLRCASASFCKPLTIKQAKIVIIIF